MSLESSRDEMGEGVALDWTIDSGNKLVVVVADGPVTRLDVERCLAAVRGADASAYRKLLDCSKLILAMDDINLLELGSRIRARHHQPVGPLAVVLPQPPLDARLGRLLGIMAMADRPIRIFKNRTAGRRWLSRLPTPAEATNEPAD